MTNIPVSRERFAAFTEDERSVMHLALQRLAERIIDKAVAEQYPGENLTEAAAAYAVTASLMGECGVTLGAPELDDETIQTMAVCIAEGEAPFAARMAAEVEPALAPLGAAALGAHADVSVTPGEDAVTA